jgi:hypothetical protein|tara:strand:+ start:3695 stop:3829 length:135 start_codon:yes stop_codon:yes gene_type:complete
MKSLFFIFSFSLITFFALDSSLDEMTKRDCEIGKIPAACEQLKK